jgi:RNA polymerase sigma-70 factor (ECF subfamily)
MKPVPLHLVREPPTAEVGDLGALFRAHGRYVANVAFRLLGRDSEVDDVVQDVFLEAASGLHSIRDPGAVRGWLATIAVRVVSRKLRWRRVRRLFLQAELPEGPPVQAPAPPDQRVLL